jgi:hypothetical protein
MDMYRLLKIMREAEAADLPAVVPGAESSDGVDTVTMDVPLLLRVLEYAREDAEQDVDLHALADSLIELSKQGTVTMDQYDQLVPASDDQLEEWADNIVEQGVAEGETDGPRFSSREEAVRYLFNKQKEERAQRQKEREEKKEKQKQQGVVEGITDAGMTIYKQVVKLLDDGYEDEQIADELGISLEKVHDILDRKYKVGKYSKGNIKPDSVEEDLDKNQKRVKQLGPKDKVGKKEKLGEGEVLPFDRPAKSTSGKKDEWYSKQAYKDGERLGFSIVDVHPVSKAIKIHHWDSPMEDGISYASDFIKGFMVGRQHKVDLDNRQYNMDLRVNKDGSITDHTNTKEGAVHNIPESYGWAPSSQPEDQTTATFSQTKHLGDAQVTVSANAKNMADLHRVLELAGVSLDSMPVTAEPEADVQVVEPESEPSACGCGSDTEYSYTTDKQTIIDKLRDTLKNKLSL